MYKPNTSNHSTQRAVALKYSQANADQAKNVAPKVVAKGTGDIAQEMIALAQQHGVLIHKDDDLSQLLAQLDLGQEIPESLYHVIAELIAFSYVLQGKFPNSWKNTLGHIDFTE
jgi:flagellar biosynthesis protein